MSLSDPSRAQRVYLDNNGSTPLTPPVTAALHGFIEGHWGNSGATHADGLEASAAIRRASAQVAAAIGGRAEEITFTSGGTESNNTVLFGLAESPRATQRRHLVVGLHEHYSVIRPAEALERRGFEVTWLSPGADGAIRIEDLKAAVREDTLLVSVMLANNETGVLQPVRQAARVAHDAGALLFVDAVCGVGKIPVDVRDLDCDLLTLSGHKLHAPKGIGALWAREGVEWAPYVHGCGQQGGRRSGTENTMGAVALGAAMEHHGAPGRTLEDEVHGDGSTPRGLRDELWQGILALGVGAERNGAGADLPNTVSVRFPGRSALEIQERLGERAISAGAQAGKPSPEDPAARPRPSHVLMAMGMGEECATESLRFSLGSTTTRSDIHAALGALAGALGVDAPVVSPESCAPRSGAPVPRAALPTNVPSKPFPIR